MATANLRKTAHATMISLSSVSAELTRAALNLPHTYSNYVASNASSISNVESSLRSLSYLLPGARLHDSELAAESLQTFVQLLSIYHDHLLSRRATILAESATFRGAKDVLPQKPKPSLHAKYTLFWTKSSNLYTRVATLLKIAEYTQLLWEMIAKRKGDERTRWRVVILLEAFKAFCRLVLMKLTNSRPLVSPPMPSREDIAPVEPENRNLDDFSEDELKVSDDNNIFDARSAFGDAGVPTPPLSDSGKTPITTGAESFTMPRTGLTLPALPTPDSVSQYLLSNVLTADDVKPARQLLHRLTTLQGQAAEVIYILRPVIYALLMQRTARAYGYEGTKWRKHWTPWLIGISIEYFSRQIAKRDLASRVPGGARGGLSALERDELKKRGWNLAWWGLRGAFYENITKKYVQGIGNTLRGRPVLDLVGAVVDDYDYLWSNYHFSAATM